MNALLQRGFAHAHAQTIREFTLTDPADATYLWILLLPGSEEYAPPIPVMRGSLRAQNAPLPGSLTLSVDAITLDAIKSAFPRPPRLDDLCLLAPRLPDAVPAVPDPARAKTYILTGIGDTEINAHYHLTAELHI